METLSENLYSIQFVSNVTGINPHTIRAWEKRYGATNPHRDKNGKRLYSDTQINRLKVLHTLVNFGNSISDVAKLTKQELETVLKKYNLVPDETLNVSQEFDVGACVERLKMSVNFFKLDVLAHELEKAEEKLNALDFSMHIILPLVKEIRILKAEKSLNEEEREQLYLIIKSHLHRVMPKQNLKKAIPGRRVIVSAPSGDLNEVCAIMASILFIESRFKVEYLGGNIKASMLGKIEKQFSPTYVFTALNYSHDIVFSQDQKQTYLNELNLHLNERDKLLIGAFDYEVKGSDKSVQTILGFENILEQLQKL